jgi:hypothetical protein
MNVRIRGRWWGHCRRDVSATAATVYTYTGNAPTSFIITLTTSLSGAALHNLGAGTGASLSDSRPRL